MQTPTEISLETATELACAIVGEPLSVTAIDPLHGGMVNLVQRWETDGEPASVVAKVSNHPEPLLDREMASLRWYAENSELPVPHVYGCATGVAGFGGSCLLMQYIPGRHLAPDGLSPAGWRHVQEQLAAHVADLHALRRDRYGSDVNDEQFDRWADWFGVKLQYNLRRAAVNLSPAARQVGERLLADLEQWLPEFGQPTLVHGDLWSTNILIDADTPDRPDIAAFIDPGPALFCEVEYELAYLRVFGTADRHFFNTYSKRHLLREGFDRRCRVYWFNTMLLHVWMFGDDFLPRCEAIADELARLA